jgi:hypothetical protein
MRCWWLIRVLHTWRSEYGGACDDGIEKGESRVVVVVEEGRMGEMSERGEAVAPNERVLQHT